MLKRFTLAFIAVTCLAVVSCKKDYEYVEAKVIDTGDITNEGCGYLLELEDQALVQPNYLPSAYQHDGMLVKVQYTHTGVQDTCDYAIKIYDMVNIQKISRRVK